MESRDPEKWENWKTLIHKKRISALEQDIQQKTVMVAEDATIYVYKN